jgi:hypothetical protein
MKSASFVLLALLLLALASADALAQSSGKIPRVGYVRSGTPDVDPHRAFFVRGMRELGYVEGRDIIFEFRHYGDDTATALLIMKDLVQSKVTSLWREAALRSVPRSRRRKPFLLSWAPSAIRSGAD